MRWGGHETVGIAENPVQENLQQPSHAARPDLSVAMMVESIVGCKWSLSVLALVRQGVVRPGAMERATPGLSAKVLAERLDKMVRFGILSREQFPEVPPRVEYRLTSFGAKFVTILDAIDALQRESHAR